MFPVSFTHQLCHWDDSVFLAALLEPFPPCALPLHTALTLSPNEHVGLEVCGFGIGDRSQDTVKGGVTDLPDFLLCEQPEEKDVETSVSLASNRRELRKLEDAFSSSPSFHVLLGFAEPLPDRDKAITHSWCFRTKTCRHHAGAQTAPG